MFSPKRQAAMDRQNMAELVDRPECTRPRYHVFRNGMLTFPNDLQSMAEALDRYGKVLGTVKDDPRGTATLLTYGGRKLRKYRAKSGKSPIARRKRIGQNRIARRKAA